MSRSDGRPLLIGDRHVFPKLPNKDRRGFSWGRQYDSDTGMVTYRLFRRGLDGRIYCESKSFHASMRLAGDGPRPQIARVLRSMRAQLRWAVDQVDFQVLGLRDATPEPQITHDYRPFL